MPIDIDPNGYTAQMTDAEVTAELDRFRAAHRKSEIAELDRQLDQYRGARKRWGAADMAVAHTQILQVKAGTPRAAMDLHPFAESLLADCGMPSLKDLASAACVARQWSGADVLAWSSPGVSHLVEILSSVANTFIVNRQADLLAPILKTCAARETKNYLPTKAATVELQTGIDPATVLAPTPWQTVAPTASAENVQLAKSPVRIVYSEQDVVNDDVGVFLEIIRAVMIAAAQNELEVWSALLNADVTMDDGEVAFSTAAGNALDLGAAPSETTLSAAASALHSQLVNGKRVDLQPRILLVPSDLEMTTRKAITEIYGSSSPISVVSSAYLSGDYWYLLADPEAWPVLLRATLVGDNGQSLVLMPNAPMGNENHRNLVVGGAHSYAYAIVGRVGAVRVTAS